MHVRSKRFLVIYFMDALLELVNGVSKNIKGFDVAAKNFLGKTDPTWRLGDSVADAISPHCPCFILFHIYVLLETETKIWF